MNLEPLRYLYLRRVVGTLFSVLGVDLADRLARRLGRRVYNLNTPARRLAESRLVLAASNPQSAIRNPQSIAASVYEHTARFWVEALFARRRLRDSSWRRCVVVENEQALSTLARSSRGCLFATACLGNPAVAALALGKFFRPLHVLVDTFAQPQLRAWQADLYADPRVRIINRPDASRRVPEVLANGGAVMMLADHERRVGRSVPAAFLGRTLNCYPTLGRLAKWFDAPIAVVSCLRGSRAFRFHLSLHEVITPTADTDTLVRLTMTALERAILSHPEQYLWSLPASAFEASAVEAGAARTSHALGSPRSGGRESAHPAELHGAQARSLTLKTEIRGMTVGDLAVQAGPETLGVSEDSPWRRSVVSGQSR